MLSIGEFSVVTKLSVKTLRFYHEQGILVPDHIDESTSYRYYSERSIARAEAIRLLREMGFGIGEIAELLSGHEDDADLAPALRRKREEIKTQIARLGDALAKIDFGLKTAAQDERHDPASRLRRRTSRTSCSPGTGTRESIRT